MPPSWQEQLHQSLNPKPESGNRSRIAIVGIGNEFNGDDAAGVILARTLLPRIPPTAKQSVLILDAGPAPENITVDLRDFRPDLVILVDAAQMDAAPGTIAWLPWDSVSGMSAASHMLPLSMLARYLEMDFGCRVALLGIQPAANEWDTPLSPPVEEAIRALVDWFSENL